MSSEERIKEEILNEIKAKKAFLSEEDKRTLANELLNLITTDMLKDILVKTEEKKRMPDAKRES